MVVGKAGAGHTGQREDPRLVRVLVWSDDACDTGDDAPFFQRRCALELDERDGSEDGIGEGRVEQVHERELNVASYVQYHVIVHSQCTRLATRAFLIFNLPQIRQCAHPPSRRHLQPHPLHRPPCTARRLNTQWR